MVAMSNNTGDTDECENGADCSDGSFGGWKSVRGAPKIWRKQKYGVFNLQSRDNIVSERQLLQHGGTSSPTERCRSSGIPSVTGVCINPARVRSGSHCAAVVGRSRRDVQHATSYRRTTSRKDKSRGFALSTYWIRRKERVVE